MWNSKKYSELIKNIKENCGGELYGMDIRTKEHVYQAIAKEIHANNQTLKSWTRKSSNGPGDRDLEKELMLILGLGPNALRKQSDKEMENMPASNLTDFNKSAILRCYKYIKQYLHNDDIENEECFAAMLSSVESEKIAIPNNIFNKFDIFIDKYIAPIIYENEIVFKNCYTDDIGYYDEKGMWVLKNKECTLKFCSRFLEAIFEIEKSLDEFAMKEIHLYLI